MVIFVSVGRWSLMIMLRTRRPFLEITVVFMPMRRRAPEMRGRWPVMMVMVLVLIAPVRRRRRHTFRMIMVVVARRRRTPEMRRRRTVVVGAMFRVPVWRRWWHAFGVTVMGTPEWLVFVVVVVFGRRAPGRRATIMSRGRTPVMGRMFPSLLASHATTVNFSARGKVERGRARAPSGTRVGWRDDMEKNENE